MLKWCFIVIFVQVLQINLVKGCPKCQAAAAAVYNPEPEYNPGVSFWDAIQKPPCAAPLPFYQPPPPPPPKYKCPLLPSAPCRCSQRVTKTPSCAACLAEKKALIQEKFEQLKSKLCSIFCREDCIHSRPKPPPPCSCRKSPCGCY